MFDDGGEGNLADLEELNRTPGRVHCSRILDEAIDVARRHYDNRHVYPYTYQAGYFYRNRMYKEALESWANAADVIRTYAPHHSQPPFPTFQSQLKLSDPFDRLLMAGTITHGTTRRSTKNSWRLPTS